MFWVDLDGMNAVLFNILTLQQNLCPILWKDSAGFPYVHYNCIDSVQ